MFIIRCKDTIIWSILQIFIHLFGNLARFHLGTWRDFFWEFGTIPFGNLAQFRSVMSFLHRPRRCADLFLLRFLLHKVVLDAVFVVFGFHALIAEGVAHVQLRLRNRNADVLHLRVVSFSLFL